MRVARVFVPERLVEGACVAFPGEVAEHLGRVLCLGPGADLMLFNGEGGEWQATIEVLERVRVGVRVPWLLPVATVDEWLSGVVPGLKLLLIRREGACSFPSSPHPSITLLGPEGGFAEEEASAAERAGYRALRLSPRVLRTETAAVAALSALQALWGDLA